MKTHKTCLSLSCSEWLSICCKASREAVSSDEGTGYYRCSECKKEYIAGECDAEEDWHDMYPLDTFHGKTKDELVCFIESILENQARLFIEEIGKKKLNSVESLESIGCRYYNEGLDEAVSLVTSLSGIK